MAAELADLAEAAVHGGVDLDRGRVMVTGPWAAGTSTLLRQAARRLRHHGFDVRATVGEAATPATVTGHGDAGPLAALIVDDAHRISPATAEALRELILNSSVAVLLGGRRGAPLLAPLEWLLSSGAVRTVETPRLTAEGIASLVPDHGRFHRATTARLLELADGRVGPWADLVDSSSSSGTLRRRNGLWRLIGAPDYTRFRERAQRELAQVSPQAAAVAAIIAAAELVPPSAVELLDPGPFRELRDRGLTASSPQGVRLHPPALGAALTSPATQLPPRIGEVLLATASSASAWHRVRWFEATGTPISDPDLESAARERWEAGDLHGAVRLLDRIDHDVSILRLKAELLSEIGDRARAVTTLQRIQRQGSPHERQASALDQVAITMWDIGTRDQTAVLLRQPADPEPPELRLRRALLCLESGEPTTARTLAESLSHDREPSAAVLSVIGIVEAFAGDTGRAVEITAQAVGAPAAGLPAPDVPMLTHIEALRLHGDLAQANDLAIDHYQRALSLGRSAQAWAALMRAQLATESGELTAASEFAIEAVELFADLDQHALLRWSVATALIVACRRGDDIEISRWQARLAEIPPSGVSYVEPDALRAQAWAAAATDDVAAAREILLDAVERAGGDGLPNVAAVAGHDLVRLDSPESALDLLITRHVSSPNRWSGPRVDHAQAMLDHDPAMLLRAAEAFWDIGARLVASETALKAAAMARSRSASTSRRAQGLLRRWRAQRYLASRVLQRQARFLELTAREREVCELAVTGLTNRQIADRLDIAPRTAQNLLHRAYQKLDVHDRDGLRADFGETI